MTSPARSCVSVATPRTNVPAYSLASLTSRSCTFVPRPTVSRSRPVAIGSRVPQWPIFLVPSFRRATATTSCDVIPSALSTSRTPSGEPSALNGFINFLQHFLFDLGQRPQNARTGSERVSAATKRLANRGDIDPFIFRTHADADLPVGEFFEKDCDDDAANCPKMIDQAFVVFGNDTKFSGGLKAKAKCCHPARFTKSHRLQQFTQ